MLLLSNSYVLYSFFHLILTLANFCVFSSFRLAHELLPVILTYPSRLPTIPMSITLSTWTVTLSLGPSFTISLHLAQIGVALLVTIWGTCKSRIFFRNDFFKSDVETCGRFTFPGEWLKNDTNNVFEFALPYNASGGDVNFRNYSISVLWVSLQPSSLHGDAYMSLQVWRYPAWALRLDAKFEREKGFCTYVKKDTFLYHQMSGKKKLEEVWTLCKSFIMRYFVMQKRFSITSNNTSKLLYLPR